MDAIDKTAEQWTAVEVSEWLTSMGSPYHEYAKAFLGEYTESVPCSLYSNRWSRVDTRMLLYNM